MEEPRAGMLVKVATGGPELDGIIFDLPSPAKAVVALIDAKRGPVLRSVDVDTLTEREEEGKQDAALRSLIRRTPHTARGGGGGAKGVQGRAGHTRTTMHRRSAGG